MAAARSRSLPRSRTPALPAPVGDGPVRTRCPAPRTRAALPRAARFVLGWSAECLRVEGSTRCRCGHRGTAAARRRLVSAWGGEEGKSKV